MKTREHEKAEALVEVLFADLNDRSGFSTDGVDDKDIKKWKDGWTAIIESVLKTPWTP